MAIINATPLIALDALVLDTETTGLDPLAGHRVVEVGCIELVNTVATGRTFHAYFNPEMIMPTGAQDIHGLTDEFLALMSGLAHALRQDPELAQVQRAHLIGQDPVAEVIIDRAAARGEVPARARADLAGLAHEVIEAQLFRQMMTGGPLDEAFATHVVDDLVLPVLHRRSRGAGPRSR